MTASSHVPVAILGAGLTGMAAAYHLRRAGARARIFEKQPHPGGHVITVEEGGFRFDRTGHLLHLRDPETRKLALSWIGDDWVEVDRRSMIWSNGVYTRYPFQANTFGLPPQVAYDCLMGFLAAQRGEGRPEPQNFEEFCLQRFGEGFSRHFMIPYNTRLWGVPPSEITAAWCSRFVPLPKLEDVVAGAVGLNDRELGYNTRFVYPSLGIQALTDGLARAAGDIELRRAPKAIDLHERVIHFDGEAVSFDVLISTIPLPVLIDLLEGAPAALKEAGRALRCTHLYYLDVGLNEPSGAPYHWVYVPEERYPFYRVGCYSHFSPRMAPPGKAGLYVELADRREPDMGALVPEVARALTEMRFISGPSAMELVRLRRIDHAYVIFDHAYYGALSAITPHLSSARILSAGRYGGWNYSSMEDALHFGRDAARDALALLQDPS